MRSQTIGRHLLGNTHAGNRCKVMNNSRNRKRAKSNYAELACVLTGSLKRIHRCLNWVSPQQLALVTCEQVIKISSNFSVATSKPASDLLRSMERTN